MNKADIRAQMKAELKKITVDQRHTRSLAACNLLTTTREFHDAQVIMIFFSDHSEVETSTLALHAWNEGKTIAGPRVLWETSEMEPVEVSSLETRPHPLAAGVREPVQGRPISPRMIDLIVVPGVAFDRWGYRVGRGKGFYDRFFSGKDIRGVRVALCFHEQLLADRIPVEPHDVPMHLIVTDKEIVHCFHESPTAH
ncbi:MAG: 5-formyltetrahydrofolate cyclo-ligase [Phycisphaerae bacterium]